MVLTNCCFVFQKNFLSSTIGFEKWNFPALGFSSLIPLATGLKES